MLRRWKSRNGYRDVLSVSLPLIVSMGSVTLMQFTDRIFLGRYSLAAIAAALPAGIASFLFVSFFLGAVSFTGVFVAQYAGAGRPQRIGCALWQGLYFSLAAWVLLILAGVFLAEPIFSLAGHPPEIKELEIIYFRIMTIAGGLPIIEQALASFYTGRGLTRVVMAVNLFGAALNIPLDYILINGLGPLPAMGVRGAALATAAAWVVAGVIYVRLIFTRANEAAYAVRSGARPDLALMRRLVRFGLPGGVQFFLDIFAITFFSLMIGRLGETQLAATNMAISINMLAFLPMIGLSVGVSVMVGQAMGAKKPEEAHQATVSALHLTLLYMAAVGCVFVLVPEALLGLFKPRGMEPAQFAPIISLGTVLLRFVAVYSLCDAACLVFFGALKGAGDIAYVMRVMLAVSLAVMILPLTVGIELFGAGVYFAWSCVSLYVALLAWAFWRRYRRGLWRAMEVIEAAPEAT